MDYEKSDATMVATMTGQDGQVFAGIDDMLVLLRRRAREWFPDDGKLHSKFDQVIQEALYTVKAQHSVAAEAGEVQESLIAYFESAATFRENHIPDDKPWNPKNEKYARSLRLVLAYVKALPFDHPTFKQLADCEHYVDEYEGFKVPGDEWQHVIHCQTDDPADWYDNWVCRLI